MKKNLLQFIFLTGLIFIVPFGHLAAQSANLTGEEKKWVTEHPDITLVIGSTQEPAIIMRPDGTLKGIVPDYLQIIEERTGLSIELESFDTAAEAHAAAKLTGRYGHAMTINTPVNRERYVLTDPYSSSKIVVFTRKEDLQAIRGPGDLAGKAVAIPRGNAALIGYLNQIEGVDIVEVDTPQEQLRRLQYRDADAILGFITYHYLIQKSLFTDVFIAFETDRALDIAIGVNPDYRELAEILNKGIAGITDEIRSRTLNKWLNYTAGQTAGINLTPAEKRYLQQLGTLRMSVDPDWMPFERINSAGEYEGIIADYMRLFSERLGIPFELVITDNFRESLRLLEDGRCDIFAANVATADMLERFYATKPYYNSPRVFAVHADSPLITDFGQIADKKIGVHAGSPAVTILPEIYPQCRPVPIESTDRGLQLVAAKDLDAFVSVLGTISYSIQQQGLRSVKIGGAIPSEVPLSIIVSKELPELVPILDKAVASLTEEDHREISNKWIGVIYEEGVDYSIIWKILIGVAAVIGFFIYRQYAVRKVNKRLQAAEAELKRKNEELNLLSMTDTLTGLLNRRAIEPRFDMEMGRSNRFQFPVSLLVLDIDHFKQVNDRFGHDHGDAVLKGVADMLRRGIRSTDSVARWGGEEFIILVPDTNADKAGALAEKLRQEIENLQFDTVGTVTASFGIAAYHPGERFPEWFVRADEALYRAKKEGRNRVVADEDDFGWESAGEVDAGILRITWTKEFQSGYKKIDREHRELVNRANVIIDTHIREKDNKLIRELLRVFSKDMREHFTNEEQFLEEINYSGLELQWDSHRTLLRELDDVNKRYADGEADTFSFLRFITQNLIVDHILTVDKKYFR